MCIQTFYTDVTTRFDPDVVPFPFIGFEDLDDAETLPGLPTELYGSAPRCD
jgi:hypothetical protein